LYQKTLKQLQSETAKIVNGIVELTWYMRGGLQYHDAMSLTPGEKDIMRSFLDHRMEKLKDSTFPVY
jgi:hypothetical protein